MDVPRGAHVRERWESKEESDQWQADPMLELMDVPRGAHVRERWESKEESDQWQADPMLELWGRENT